MKTLFLILISIIQLSAQSDKFLLPFDDENVLLPDTLYHSNFTTNADGWTATSTVVAGNIDAISDGTTSKDNVLRVTVLDANSTQKRINRVISFEAGKSYYITFDYYIPSGQSNLDGGVITNVVFNPQIFFTSVSETPLTIGAWSHYSFFTTVTSGTSVRIYLYDGADITWADAGADDLIYFSNIYIYSYPE